MIDSNLKRKSLLINDNGQKLVEICISCFSFRQMKYLMISIIVRNEIKQLLIYG